MIFVWVTKAVRKKYSAKHGMFILKFNGAERNHAWIYSILLNVMYVVKALFLNKPINVYLHICVNMHSFTFNHIIKLEKTTIFFLC